MLEPLPQKASEHHGGGVASAGPGEIAIDGADSAASHREARGNTFGEPSSFGVQQATTLHEGAKTQVRELELRFHLLVDAVTDYAIFMLDTEGRVASWNRGAERIKGYKADEIVGQHFAAFYPLQDRLAGKPRQELEVAGRLGRYEEEGWRLRKDGSQFWACIVITAIRDDHDVLVGYAKVSRDLTIQKLNEERQQTLTRRLTLALQVSSAGVWDWDINRNVVDCDEALCRIYGITTRTSIDYREWRSAVLPEDLDGVEAGLRLAITRKHAQSRSFRIRHPEHGIRHVEAAYTVVLDPDGHVTRVVGVVLDVTRREQAAEAARKSATQLDRTLTLLSKQHQQIRVLGELGETLQKCADLDEVRAPIRNFMPILFPGSSGRCYLRHDSGQHLGIVAEWGNGSGSSPAVPPSECWSVRTGEACWNDTRDGICCRHLQHPEQMGLALCMPIFVQGDTLGMVVIQPARTAASGIEPQAREELERMASMTSDRIGVAIANINLSNSLRQQSIRDPLTGLFNRRYLEECLDRELSRAARDQTRFAVLIIDVDYFKRVNDTYGHHVGDQVLRSIGETLVGTCRASDLVCRFGGEEFVVLLPTITPEQAMAKAEAIRNAVKRIDPVAIGGMTQMVTVSVGVAVFPIHGDSRDRLLQSADEALYAAKRSGRDRVVCAELLPTSPLKA